MVSAPMTNMMLPMSGRSHPVKVATLVIRMIAMSVRIMAFRPVWLIFMS